MPRTTIMLPAALKARAKRKARKMGISLAEFIRNSVEQVLVAKKHPEATLFDLVVYTGPAASDVSSRVDDYLVAAQGMRESSWSATHLSRPCQ